MFDPYHKWLGIPRTQQPPTYYQLLGLTPGEDDPEVIQGAAVRQTTHVQSYQDGPHAAAAGRLLREIAQARAVLLDPVKRREYDQALVARATPPLSGSVAGSAEGETVGEVGLSHLTVVVRRVRVPQPSVTWSLLLVGSFLVIGTAVAAVLLIKFR